MFTLFNFTGIRLDVLKGLWYRITKSLVVWAVKMQDWTMHLFFLLLLGLYFILLQLEQIPLDFITHHCHVQGSWIMSSYIWSMSEVYIMIYLKYIDSRKLIQTSKTNLISLLIQTVKNVNVLIYLDAFDLIWFRCLILHYIILNVLNKSLLL